MSRYQLTRPAFNDLREILEYVAADKPTAARRVGERFATTFRSLAANPGLGHIREDLTVRPVRFWPLYSYLIIYRADTTPIQILRVLSGFRDIATLLGSTDFES